MKLRVVDMFSGDRVTDLHAAKAAGLIGIIHKASQGTHYKDSRYDELRALAKSAGLLWGAYHFGDNSLVQDQVANFLSVAKPDDQTLLALDFESLGHTTMSLEQARQFMISVDAWAQRSTVFYSGNLAKEQLGTKPDKFFGAHRLWLAQYGPTPHVQASWKSAWLWQYSGDGVGPPPHSISGIPGDSKGTIDCNDFTIPEADFRAMWAGLALPASSVVPIPAMPSGTAPVTVPPIIDAYPPTPPAFDLLKWLKGLFK